jgi:uroporphyrinogen decarboxylase
LFYQFSVLQTLSCSDPALLDALLSHLADAMSEYIMYQINSGAQCVQIFDSWGGQLPPQQWDR